MPGPRRRRLPRASALENLPQSRTYASQLKKGWALLRGWMLVYGMIDFTAAAEEIDLRLRGFVNYCWKHGAKFYIVRATVLGVQLRSPRLRYHLQATWSCLSNWHGSLPWEPRRPFPKTLLLYAFLEALNQGMVAETPVMVRRWVVVACLIRLGFFALLRPAEMLALRPMDLGISLNAEGMLVMVVAIVKPKTRRVVGAGRMQSVLVTDVGTVKWMQFLGLGMKSDERFWDLSKALVRTYVSTLMTVCRLEALRLTPASMRAGGATDAFINGISIESLSFKGRWLSIQSLRSYLQEAGAQLAWSRAAQDAQARSQEFLVRYRTLLASPPPLNQHLPKGWTRSWPRGPKS